MTVITPRCHGLHPSGKGPSTETNAIYVGWPLRNCAAGIRTSLPSCTTTIAVSVCTAIRRASSAARCKPANDPRKSGFLALESSCGFTCSPYFRVTACMPRSDRIEGAAGERLPYAAGRPPSPGAVGLSSSYAPAIAGTIAARSLRRQYYLIGPVSLSAPVTCSGVIDYKEAAQYGTDSTQMIGLVPGHDQFAQTLHRLSDH